MADPNNAVAEARVGERRTTCRACRRPIRLHPQRDTSGWVEGTETRADPYGREAKWCHYGGLVCSRECDARACLDLEQTMPGHGMGQKVVGSYAREAINRNWPDA